MKYTKQELIEKLNEQQTKLNMCIETLIDYASKGLNKKPAEECLFKIGVERVEKGLKIVVDGEGKWIN